jgi:hypothetical protein
MIPNVMANIVANIVTTTASARPSRLLCNPRANAAAFKCTRPNVF